MLQILVPTDLGRDARPGMRFAIQWARQQKAKLLFTYILSLPRLTKWNDEQYERFAWEEKQRAGHKLEHIVTDMYAQLGVEDGHYECRVIEGAFAEPTLLEYCRHHPEIDFVCMGTHGATGIQKLFGTHAGNMVSGSGIPVVIVPKGYRARPVKSILFATDLLDYKEELQQVALLAQSFKASLDVLHILQADERMPDRETFEKVLSEEFRYPIRLHFPLQDETRAMPGNLRQQIQSIKPSLAVLFTNQDRTLFEKLFLSSKAERVAFAPPVPLMILPKNTAKKKEKESKVRMHKEV